VQKHIQKLEKELETTSALEGAQQRKQAGRHKYDQVRFRPQSGYGHRMRHGQEPVKVSIGRVEYERIITKVCD
jgi:hypothetical protein